MAVFPPAGGLSSLSAAPVLLRAFFLRGLWGAAALWRPGIHSGLLGGGVLPGLRPGWLCRFPLAGSRGCAAHHPLYAGIGRKRYASGFEESYGYLAGSYVRDKDAVVASMLICEMAAYYRTKGISMMQARENLYQKYGVYVHAQHSFTFEGESGMIRMQNIMEHHRPQI